jgi:group I intron endonuclease
MTYYVYIIQNTINLKIYVGKSFERKTSRYAEHISLAKRGAKSKDYSLIHAAISKYGEMNFTFKIIEWFDNEKDSLEAEIFWIEFFRTDVNRFGRDCGYNLTAGGDGHRKSPSKETREKIKNTLILRLEIPGVKDEIVNRLQSALKLIIHPHPLNIGCKISWPNDDDLLDMVNFSTYKKVAQILGVSNVAVRERLKRRGLYIKK